MRNEDNLKVFLMSNQILNQELQSLELKLNIDLGVVDHNQDLQEYFELFEYKIRYQAKLMSKIYEIFYCLERTIRQFVEEGMIDAFGLSWWNDKNINQNIYQEVKKRIKAEKDAGITMRSDKEIDYTTFGELGQIILQNWTIFGALFSSQNAVQKVISSLNNLRNPIAHCTILAEDEVLRLKLTLKDWFRLMDKSV